MASSFAGLNYFENARLVASDFTLQMNAYDLAANQVLVPSDDVNCITLMSAGEYAANVGRPHSGVARPRPTSWGRVGFVTAGMPASFTTGTCQLQACHLMFTNSTVERLVGSPVSWVIDDLAGFLDIGDRAIHSLMRRLHQEAISPGEGYTNMVGALGEAIAIDLYRSFSAQRRHTADRGSTLAGWQSRKIAEYVHAHVANGPVLLAELAETCGISASHLSRSFRNTEGITVQEYVEKVRVDRSRILMDDVNLTMADVARACGYAHQANFATTFRRNLGETPSTYRRRVYGRNR